MQLSDDTALVHELSDALPLPPGVVCRWSELREIGSDVELALRACGRQLVGAPIPVPGLPLRAIARVRVAVLGAVLVDLKTHEERVPAPCSTLNST